MFRTISRSLGKVGLSIAVLLPLANPAWAQPPVTVSGTWARATAPGQTDGAIYLSLKSATGDTLTAADTPAADMAMLHSTVSKGGMSGMQDMDSLALPPGKTVTLAPHGMHLMLMGLKAPLQAGQSVDLDLTFAKAGKIHLSVPVQPLSASGPPG